MELVNEEHIAFTGSRVTGFYGHYPKLYDPNSKKTVVQLSPSDVLVIIKSQVDTSRRLVSLIF